MHCSPAQQVCSFGWPPHQIVVKSRLLRFDPRTRRVFLYAGACAARFFGGLVRIAKGTSLRCRHVMAARPWPTPPTHLVSGTWSHPFNVDWESPKQANGGLAFREKQASPFSFLASEKIGALSERTTGFVTLWYAGASRCEVGGFSSFESAPSIVDASRKLSRGINPRCGDEGT